MRFFEPTITSNECNISLLNPNKHDHVVTKEFPNNTKSTSPVIDIKGDLFNFLKNDIFFFIDSYLTSNKIEKNSLLNKLENTKSTLQSYFGINQLITNQASSILNETLLSLCLTLSALVIYTAFPVLALSIGLSLCAYILYFIQEESSYPLNRVI